MPTINRINSLNTLGKTAMRTAESKFVACVSGHSLYNYVRNITVNNELQFIFSNKKEDTTIERMEGTAYTSGPKYVRRTKLKRTKLRGFSQRINYKGPSDRRLSAKLVPTIAGRGCRVLSAPDPHGY
jgi:hypothetical protein